MCFDYARAGVVRRKPEDPKRRLILEIGWFGAPQSDLLSRAPTGSARRPSTSLPGHSHPALDRGVVPGDPWQLTRRSMCAYRHVRTTRRTDDPIEILRALRSPLMDSDSYIRTGKGVSSSPKSARCVLPHSNAARSLTVVGTPLIGSLSVPCMMHPRRDLAATPFPSSVDARRDSPQEPPQRGRTIRSGGSGLSLARSGRRG